jgi:hypothetical protein
MPKRPKLRDRSDNSSLMLKGWKQIADFLGEPVSNGGKAKECRYRMAIGD